MNRHVAIVYLKAPRIRRFTFIAIISYDCRCHAVITSSSYINCYYHRHTPLLLYHILLSLILFTLLAPLRYYFIYHITIHTLFMSQQWYITFSTAIYAVVAMAFFSPCWWKVTLRPPLVLLPYIILFSVTTPYILRFLFHYCLSLLNVISTFHNIANKGYAI